MQRKGLGKGLSALIPESSILLGGRTIVNVDVNKLTPNPRQPRGEFHPDTINELADSIKAQGIMQPIIVRPRNGKYEIIAGERRWRAAKKAGLTLVPSIIKDYSDEESLAMALIENLQREDLNPMDEAEGYNRLAAEFKLTQNDISKQVGKNRSTVANMMRLSELPHEIQVSLRRNQITVGHARPLLGLESNDARTSLWKEIIKNNLTVRDVEQIIHGGKSPKDVKPRKRRHTKNAELNDLTELLTTHLGTKVRVLGSAKKGKIEIEYYSQEDLERLIEALTGAAT